MQKISLVIYKVYNALEKNNINLENLLFYVFNDIIFIGKGFEDSIYRDTEYVENYKKYNFDGIIIYYYGYALYKNKLHYAILHVYRKISNIYIDNMMQYNDNYIVQYLFLKNINNQYDIKLVHINADMSKYNEFTIFRYVNVKQMNIINLINGKQLLLNLFNKLYRNYKMEYNIDLFEDLIYLKVPFNINLIFNNLINIEIYNKIKKAKISINNYRAQFKLLVI